MKKINILICFIIVCSIVTYFFVKDKEPTPLQKKILEITELSFIHKDLSSNHNDFFEQMLINRKLDNLGFGRVTLSKNGELTIKFIAGDKSNQAQAFLEIIRKNIKKNINKFKQPFDFFVSLNDGIVYRDDILNYISKHIILLNPYSISGRKGVETLIPDYFLMNEGPRKDFIKTYKNNILFSKRIPIAKFRGSQTGGIYNMSEVKRNVITRLKASHLSLKYPNLMDIKIMGSYSTQSNGGQEYIDYMNKTFGPPTIPEQMENFNKYRYLLCFDGNSAPPFARPETIMISGSVPLFQTNYEKFWSFLLIDGVNYIKIKDDLSNLVDAINSLNADPVKAEKIAIEARKIAEEVLMPEFLDELFMRTLIKIGEKQNQSKSISN